MISAGKRCRRYSPGGEVSRRTASCYRAPGPNLTISGGMLPPAPAVRRRLPGLAPAARRAVLVPALAACPPPPPHAAGGPGALYVLNAGDRTVARLDPARGPAATLPLPPGPVPRALAPGPEGGVLVLATDSARPGVLLSLPGESAG